LERPRRKRPKSLGRKSAVKIPDDMIWDIWRIWLAGMASLEEIENKWSLCDLAEANEALDIKEEMEDEARKISEAESKRR